LGFEKAAKEGSTQKQTRKETDPKLRKNAISREFHFPKKRKKSSLETKNKKVEKKIPLRKEIVGKNGLWDVEGRDSINPEVEAPLSSKGGKRGKRGNKPWKGGADSRTGTR